VNIQQRSSQRPLLKLVPASNQKAPDFPPPGTPQSREEVFLSSASQSARTWAQVSGFCQGGSVGYLSGALVGAALDLTGNLTACTALLGALGTGLVGGKIAGKISDWAGNKAAKAFPSQAKRAECVARVGLNAAFDATCSSLGIAGVGVGFALVGGSYDAWRFKPETAPKRPPE